VTWPIAIALLLGGFAVGAASARESGSFPAEMDAAMDKMMRGMMGKPSGDVDADFVAMMVPHHQGAIDMAIAELRYGMNDRLKRIAQEIIIVQQQEIAAMRAGLGKPSLPAAPVPGNTPPKPHREH
jgi:uncharacterized protein (DUF305 family)